VKRWAEALIIVSVAAAGWVLALLLIGGYPGIILAAAWTYIPVLPLSSYFDSLERRGTISNTSERREDT
jgi:hypothetical protein